MFNTLSGRFLALTIIFVMLAEVLIFVPSIARFRQDFLTARLERAQIASLALEAEDMLSPALEAELLENAGVFNVVLRRDAARQLVLSSPIPEPVMATYDLRDPSAWVLIRDALRGLLRADDRVIRVMGYPARGGGVLIEITMSTSALRMAMVDYGLRVLALSAFISIATAVLLFFAVRRLFVVPVRSVVGHMQAYAKAPEDARKIITPASRVVELREAEDSLQSMQQELTQALLQKDRLAQLGGAVAKISHDLRNILTSAQLFTDRFEASEDPTVRRLAPKLVKSITRAVTLCETTLAYGRAEEPAPRLETLALRPLVDDVIENEQLAAGDTGYVTFTADIPGGITVLADRDQLYRILTNLTRNARQALERTGQGGHVNIAARDHVDHTEIQVSDTGPGLPAKARENLFTAFQGGTTKGGSGLGLAIAAELMRGHGGQLQLQKSDETGTEFTLTFPKPAVG